jgi:hypothetical protein
LCELVCIHWQATAYGLTEDTQTATATATTTTKSFLPLIQKQRYSHDGYLFDSFNEHASGSTTAATVTASVGCQTVDFSSGNSNSWSFGNSSCSTKNALKQQRSHNGCSNGSVAGSSVTGGSVTGSCATAVTDRTVRSVRSLARGTCATCSLWAD